MAIISDMFFEDVKLAKASRTYYYAQCCVTAKEHLDLGLDVSGTSVPVCPVMSCRSFSGVTHSATRS